MNLASSLVLYAHTPLTEALRVQPSVARAFFAGKAFSDWSKGQEAKAKLQEAVVSRLNDVIRACGAIATTTAKCFSHAFR